MIDDLIREEKSVPAMNAEAFYAHAYALYQAGQVAQAVEVFQVLCARFPLDVRYWFGLGASLQENTNYELALHAWAMAAIIDEKNPYPHFHAAECAYSLNQMNDARLALQEAKKRLSEATHPLQAKIEVLEKQWRAS